MTFCRFIKKNEAFKIFKLAQVEWKLQKKMSQFSVIAVSLLKKNQSTPCSQNIVVVVVVVDGIN